VVFSGLCVKFVLFFSTSILAKRSSAELQRQLTKKMVFILMIFLMVSIKFISTGDCFNDQECFISTWEA